MAKYAEQFKLRVVEEYTSGTEGFRLLAQRYGLDRGTLREWVAAYQFHGAEAFRAGPRRYAESFKVLVLQHMRAEGLSLRQAAARFNVRGYATIAEWRRRYDAEGAEALAPRRFRANRSMQKPPIPKTKPAKDEDRTREELLDELEDLRAEVAYLKKYHALLQAKEKAAQQKKRK
jgi:transposase